MKNSHKDVIEASKKHVIKRKQRFKVGLLEAQNKMSIDLLEFYSPPID